MFFDEHYFTSALHISILKLHKTESRTKRPLNRDYFVAALFFFSLIPSTEHKT